MKSPVIVASPPSTHTIMRPKNSCWYGESERSIEMKFRLQPEPAPVNFTENGPENAYRERKK